MYVIVSVCMLVYINLCYDCIVIVCYMIHM
nr:MAG TPA: hypothetical protein [Caudoviricetes sp.]